MDNCAFNRPFDDQSQLRVRLETEAKLGIQKGIEDGHYELAWSYILDFENEANPFEERRAAVGQWRPRAVRDAEESRQVLNTAKELAKLGLRSKDALHVACAVATECDYFISTDDGILTRLRGFPKVTAMSPTEFVGKVERRED